MTAEKYGDGRDIIGQTIARYLIAGYFMTAYPELVSRGVSKTRKCKWQVKVGASNGVTPLIKKIM